MSPDSLEVFPITIVLESGEYLCFRTQQGLIEWEIENGYLEVRHADFWDDFCTVRGGTGFPCRVISR